MTSWQLKVTVTSCIAHSVSSHLGPPTDQSKSSPLHCQGYVLVDGHWLGKSDSNRRDCQSQHPNPYLKSVLRPWPLATGRMPLWDCQVSVTGQTSAGSTTAEHQGQCENVWWSCDDGDDCVSPLCKQIQEWCKNSQTQSSVRKHQH